MFEKITNRLIFAGLFVLAVSYPALRLQGQSDAAQLEKNSLANTQKGYDPLKLNSTEPIETVLFEFDYRPQAVQMRPNGEASEVRKVPLKVYLPAIRPDKQPAPVVLFSHGLGGSREGFKHGGEHWARRGYVAVFLQHPGSDESTWREKGIGQRMTAMREAASAQNLVLRIQDVKAVIDYLETIDTGGDQTGKQLTNQAKRLQGRMDLKRLGMSGHSFGAITTQMVSGQSPIVPTQKPTDPRIKAAVVMSPSPPKLGQPDRYFGKVSIPWMLMTGTKDDSPIGDQTAESRLAVFPALPDGRKYQVVFDGGTHAFLGERAGITSATQTQSSHALATLGLSTAFWDAYLSDNEQAKIWLDGDGPKSILATADKWQTK